MTTALVTSPTQTKVYKELCIQGSRERAPLSRTMSSSPS